MNLKQLIEKKLLNPKTHKRIILKALKKAKEDQDKISKKFELTNYKIRV